VADKRDHATVIRWKTWKPRGFTKTRGASGLPSTTEDIMSLQAHIDVPQLENLLSPQSGKEVPNQFRIITKQGNFFQSYSSMIALRPSSYFFNEFADNWNEHNPGIRFPALFLSDKWDCSATTLKYLKVFLRTDKTKKEIEEAIKEGRYVVVDWLK
jgi:hypothetical protein